MAKPIDIVMRATPDRLARLVAVSEQVPEQWQTADLRAILRHQLETRLPPEFQDTVQDTVAGRFDSFGDLLYGAAPPLRVLRRMEDEVGQQCSDPHGLLPREICLVLQFALIAAAQEHAHTRIGLLSESELAEGWRWVGSLTWVDQRTKRLVKQALTSQSTQPEVG